MRPSTLVRLMLSTAGLTLALAANAQWWGPNPPPRNSIDALNGAKVVYTAAHNEQASMAIQAALDARDFAKLDRMHDEFLRLEQAGGNGKRLLESFELAIDLWAPNRDVKQLESLFSEWKNAAADSRLRMAAEARMWYALAWKARGSGYSSGVSPEAMRMFESHLARAVQLLRSTEPQAQASPVWYSTTLAVAGSLQQPSGVLDGVFEEGARLFPLHLPLYRTRLNYLLPQWGGNYDRVDAFIRAAVMRTQATEGTTFYLDLYKKVRRSYAGPAFFRDTRASWQLMKHAFEDQLSGDRDEDLTNEFATFACMASDRETTASLLAELGPRANLGVGTQDISTDGCRDFAMRSR